MKGVRGPRGKHRFKARRDGNAKVLREYRNYLRSIGLRVIGLFGAVTAAEAAKLQRQDSAKQRSST